MIEYDSQLIYEFAAALYRQAARVVVTYTIFGALVGAAIGAAVGKQGDDQVGLFALIGGVIVGAVFYSAGMARAFTLKLQAQTALCQVQIEENTRKALAQ